MKIAIVTLPLHTNYGGILQAYALQTVLERMGHEVEHLQPEVIYPKLHPYWKMPFVYCKRLMRKYFGGERSLPIFIHPQKWIRKNTDRFIAKHINCRYLKEHEWNEDLANYYDAFVFGSDQIWRPCYARPIEKYYGSFIERTNVKKIAYAASFGTEVNEYTLEQQNNCSFLLRNFDVVSVREESGVCLCKQLFDVKAKHVLDPTMLLNRNDYLKLIDKKDKLNTTGKLAVYVLDSNPDIDAVIKEVATKTDLLPYKINSKCEDGNAPICDRQQFPLENWLKAFNDADLIITDSFHACVFSIIFRKPFIVYGNISRGMARFHSLLKMFDFEDRLVTSLADFRMREDIFVMSIDYNKVSDIQKERCTESMEFIKDSINLVVSKSL